MGDKNEQDRSDCNRFLVNDLVQRSHNQQAIFRAADGSHQLGQGRLFGEKRYGAKKFIAYFQSFSSTYAPLPKLKAIYDAGLECPDVVGLFVATRPDCVDSDILALLSSYRKEHLVWIEYGLQSAHDSTLLAVNRGHDVKCFEGAVRMACDCGLDVCAHVILGLPGETRAMMLETARYLSLLPVSGVKIHLLYVVKGTKMADLYSRGAYKCLSREVREIHEVNSRPLCR